MRDYGSYLQGSAKRRVFSGRVDPARVSGFRAGFRVENSNLSAHYVTLSMYFCINTSATNRNKSRLKYKLLGLERGLDPLQAISMAHGRVRNGFTLPKMDEITSQNERLLQQVFTDEIENRLVSRASLKPRG